MRSTSASARIPASANETPRSTVSDRGKITSRQHMLNASALLAATKTKLSRTATQDGQRAARAAASAAAADPDRIQIVALLNMADFTTHTHTNVPFDEPLFDPVPRRIEYTQYQPFQTYTTTITLRNKDLVPRRVKIVPPESPYFTLSAPQFISRAQTSATGSMLSSSSDGKVAPNATVKYTLTFAPQERIDYALDLTVITEREKFLLPIRVFGDRAKLTFPGEIVFPKCPVKFPTQRPLLLHNAGTRATRFHFMASAPFFVDPPDGHIGINEHVQVIVSFCPTVEGDFDGDLVISDDDNQTYLCRVFGSAESTDVHLECSELTCPPAYLELTTQQSLKIVNCSTVPIRFDWKLFSSLEEDEEHKAMLCAQLDAEEETEREAAALAAEHGTLTVDEPLSDDEENGKEYVLLKTVQAISRKYKKLRAQVMDNPLLFDDPSFSIVPLSGEVFPNGYLEVAVRFKPSHATAYMATAYCDVTGRVSRLPILFKGHGVGPKAMFSYESLDIGEVLVGGIYHYAVTLTNIGDIDAEYALIRHDRDDQKASKKKPNHKSLALTQAHGFGDDDYATADFDGSIDTDDYKSSSSSSKSSSSRFTFTPEHGVLSADQSRKIDITFNCTTLGPFSEVVEWSLPGRAEPLTITFKGQVVAPKFKFDVAELDFGPVSFGFLQSRTLKLTNESDIPFQFALSVPMDGKYNKREFGLTPSSGLILPFGSQPVRVDFIASSQQSYNYSLHVDAEGIGAALLRLPIKARCEVPTLSLSAEKIDFGTCFLRHPYIQPVELVNPSGLPAKFEVVFTEDNNPYADSLTCEIASGSIGPRSRLPLNLRMVARHLGPVALTIFVRTVGSEAQPMSIQGTCLGVGPVLRLEQNLVDFGSISVLQAETKLLRLFNDSPIPAPFKTFVTKKESMFACHPPQGVLEPNSHIDLKITAFMDDNPKLVDTLHVLAEEGADYTAEVRGSGSGTTLVSDPMLDQYTLGPVFTGQVAKRTFRLENRGRRAQTINFEFVRRVVPKNNPALTTPQSSASKKGGAEEAAPVQDERKSVFTITPDKITLQPFTAMNFTVEGSNSLPGVVTEQWNIKSLVAGNKGATVIMSPQLIGDFICPLLETSAPPNGLFFLYSYVPGVPIMPQTQPLTLTNTSALPLVFMFKCPMPFSVDRVECELAPGESTTVGIQFDPGMKTDRVSTQIRTSIAIIYRDHTQRDQVKIGADICFPNLTFERQSVDFGCVLNETQRRVTMRVTNTSRVAARYNWAFVEEIESEPSPPPTAGGLGASGLLSMSAQQPLMLPSSRASRVGTANGNGGSASLNSTLNMALMLPPSTAPSQAYVPPPFAVNEVFDILPIRGYLQPGESEEVQFIFFGHTDTRMKTLAVCEVQGGPEYEIPLKGEAGSIQYRLDRDLLDFGEQEFSQQRVQELVLYNQSRVPFDFVVNTHSLKLAHAVSVTPMSGRVRAQEKQRLLVTFFPGLPFDIEEMFTVQVAHFDPQVVRVRGRGLFAQLLSSLPRSEDSALLRLLPEVMKQPRFLTSQSQPAAGGLVPLAALAVGGDRTSRIATANAAAGLVADGADQNSSSSSSSSSTLIDPSMLQPSHPATSRDPASSSSSPVPPADGEPVILSSKPTSRSGLPVPSTPAITMTALAEVEAERMCFVEFLQRQKASYLAPTLAMDPAALLQAQNANGARISSPAPGLVALCASSSSASAPYKAPDFVLASFVCQLGHIIRGTNKSRRFKLTNVSRLPLSFEVNQKALALARGAFTISPMKVNRLPEGESVELTVTFQAGANADMKPVEIDVPLDIKDGAPYMMQLRANVTQPALDLSRSSIDMGAVALGFAKQVRIHMYNPAPIPTEWVVGKLTARFAEEVSLLSVTPSNGVVAPGETTVLTVVFRPRAPLADIINAKLPIKITSNPKTLQISLRAQVVDAGLRVEPSSLSMGPIIPGRPSQAGAVRLINDSDTDVEVHSLDFDAKFLAEEEVLRALTGWDERNEMWVAPRLAGQPLPPSVLAIAQHQQNDKLIAELKERVAPAAVNAPTIPVDPAASSSDGSSTSRPSTANLAGVLPPTSILPLTVPDVPPANAVHTWVVGPPLSGVSSAALALARHLHVPLLNFQQMLNFFTQEPAGAQIDADLAERLKQSIQPTRDDFTQKERGASLLAAIVRGYFAAYPALQLTGAVIDGCDCHNATPAVMVAAMREAMMAIDRDRLQPLSWHVLLLDGVENEALLARLDSVRAATNDEITSLGKKVEKTWAAQLKTFKFLTLDEQCRLSPDELTKYKDLASKQTVLNNKTMLTERVEKQLVPARIQERLQLWSDARALIQSELLSNALSVAPVVPAAAAPPLADVDTSLNTTASLDDTIALSEAETTAGPNDTQFQVSASAAVPAIASSRAAGSRMNSRPATSRVAGAAASAVPPPPKYWLRHSILDAKLTVPDMVHSAESLLSLGADQATSVMAGAAAQNPDDVLFQILSLPAQRLPRNPIVNFQLVDLSALESKEDQVSDASATASSAAAAAAAAAATRWVVPARSSAQFAIRYLSETTGRHEATMAFEVFGRSRQYTLALRGVCAFPEISSDPRAVFVRRIKTKKAGTIVKKQHVTDQNVFDFGPVLIGRGGDANNGGPIANSAARHDKAIMRACAESFRITNTGLFPAHIDFSLRGQVSESSSASRPQSASAVPVAAAAPAAPAAKGKPDPKGKAAPVVEAAPPPPPPARAFVFEPEFLELQPDEVKEVTVWAFPAEVGTLEDALVCTVKENPTPVIFPLRCEGARPSCDLSESSLVFDRMIINQTDKKTIQLINTSPLPVAWGLSYTPEPPAPPPAVPAAPAGKGKPDPAAAAAAAQAAQAAAAAAAAEMGPPVFPVAGPNGISTLTLDELKIEPASGILKPLTQVEITIDYAALKQRVIDRKFKLEIRDSESAPVVQSVHVSVNAGTSPVPVAAPPAAAAAAPSASAGNVVAEIKTLSVQAEAFEIDYKLDLPPTGLDFGSVRVLEEGKREFTLKNEGKYEIKYNFSSAPLPQAASSSSSMFGSPAKAPKPRKDVLAEVITVQPSSGQLKPQEEVKVSMSFCSRAREVALKSNSDMKLQIVEAQTQSSVPPIPIRISAAAVYSKYRILPFQGINFGPIEVDTSKQKKLEIYNDGEFDFDFKLLAAPKVLPKPGARPTTSSRSERPPSASAASAAPASAAGGARPPTSSGKPDPKAKGGKVDPKAAAAAAAAPPKAPELVIGPFTLTPALGTVPRGGKIVIDINLLARNAAESYQENIEIDITNRDPAKDPQIFYELAGEAVAPGIETEDFESIFEEQSVERVVEKRREGKNVFSVEDRVFVYAPVIAASGDGTNAPTRPSTSSGSSKSEPAGGPSLPGTIERFKIINPFKVPCNVQFEIKPRNASDPKAVEEASAFRLEPAALHIPSHEYRFVSVSFAPRDMATFRAQFVATVEKGAAAGKNGSLSFELRGQGTLPRVTMERPSARDESGVPLLQFGRMFLGRAQRQQMIVLRNEGIIPATCRLEMPGAIFGSSEAAQQQQFRYLGRSVVTIAPQQTARLPVAFRPSSVGTHQGELQLSVAQNPFEDTTIRFVGEAYQEDVTIEGLDGAASSSSSAQQRPGTAQIEVIEDDGKEELKDKDEIDFGDVAVGSRQMRSFTLTNHSKTTYRFSWPAGHSSVKFEPCIGHLAPHNSKTVQVICSPSQGGTLTGEAFNVKLEQIAIDDEDVLLGDNEDASGWDDAQTDSVLMTDRQYAAFQALVAKREEILKKQAEAAAAAAAFAAAAAAAPVDPKAKGKAAPPLEPPKVEIEPLPALVVPDLEADDDGEPQSRNMPRPEPKHRVLPAPADAAAKTPLAVRVRAVFDLTRYALEVPQNTATFRATMMFQSRVFKFPLRNLSSTQLVYSWKLRMLSPTDDALARAEPPLIPVHNLCPFSVSPATGRIAPNQEEEFVVKFAPWDAIDYQCELVADVEALDPALPPPRLVLNGSGLRPKCHVELAVSDYLSSGRRAADMRNADGTVGALDATQFRVVELSSLGTRVRNTKRFFVLNPTNLSYSFEWTCQDSPALLAAVGPSPLRCTTTKGAVLAGKRAEMVIEYAPDEVGVRESFWRFSIPEHDIHVNFVFVGTVAEPELSLERTHINFNALLVGATAQETATLINHEHLPFAFTVDPASYQADGALEIEPTSGVVPPDGHFPVQLRFKPRDEKSYNFNVLFRIRNKPGRVVLNVKGEGYAIRDSLQLEESDGRQVDLSATQLTRLDFGVVQLAERQVKCVAITNSGKFNFDFHWSFATRSKLVEISPEHGTVKRGAKAYCDISFVGDHEEALDRLRAVCTVANGVRQYVALISGTARRPQLDISSTDIDFGPMFVGARPTVQTIRVTNREAQRNVTVETVFENKAHLEIRGAAAVLAPSESTEFQLVFTPRDLQIYQDVVRLEFNAGYHVDVPVRGEGCALRLELASPAQQNVQFGNLRLGSSATRTVRVVNASKKTVRFALKPNGLLAAPSSPASSSSTLGLAELESKSNSTDLLATLSGASSSSPNNVLDISFIPHPTAAAPLELRPRQSLDMTIRYAPRARMAAFSEELSVDVEGMVRPLLRVSGACHGVGLAFESDNIPFAPTVLHSSVSRRLMLENVGDVGCRFRFEADKFAPDFSISPVDGFVPAHEQLTLEINFHPSKVNADIRYSRIPCHVEGAPTLYLTLTGSCTAAPEDTIGELKFDPQVRRSQTRTVTLHNDTNVKWSLRPSISHEFWSGATTLDVPPGAKVDYDVTYRPLRTTAAGQAPDQGELFFALPDGKAKVWTLIGTASPPDAEGTIDVEAPCKKLLVKALPVKNWLSRAQRFKVVIETEQQDPSVSIKGATSIEVPGLMERELKLSFYAYKEGLTRSTVRFINESTGEFMFYHINFKASQAGILAHLPLESPVRQRVSSLVSIRNPLDFPAEISRFECDSPDVFVQLPIRVASDSEQPVEVWFRPLARLRKQAATLTLFSPELGDFRYSLELTGSSLPNERTLRFDTSLGGEHVQTFRFTSFEMAACEFECKISGNEFRVDQARVKAQGAARGSDGETLSVDVRYEPTNLGDVRDVLVITPLNGKGSAEYRVPLYGHCDPPKPLGPFTVRPGQPVRVDFKNVFANAETFTYSVDNPTFVLSKRSTLIQPKGTDIIEVSLNVPGAHAPAGGKDGKKKDAAAAAASAAAPVLSPSGKPLMAKLMVSCPNMPPWIYYLRAM